MSPAPGSMVRSEATLPVASPAGSRLTMLEAKIRTAQRQGATAEVRIALAVVPVLRRWNDYRTEARGLSGPQWLAEVTGNPKAAEKMIRRYDALLALEKAIHAGPLDQDFLRTRIASAAIVYLAGTSVPQDRRGEAVREVIAATHKHGTVLEPSQVRRVVQGMLGSTRAPKPLSVTAAELRQWVEGPLDAFLEAFARDGQAPWPAPPAGISMPRAEALVQKGKAAGKKG